MTKDKKSNQIKAEKPHNQHKVQSGPSVRLLTKIEIKGQGMPHNILVPATSSQTVEGFMKSMQEKFNNQFKFDHVFIDSQNGQYKVENQYTIGQCFKDFDNIIVKGTQSEAKATPKAQGEVLQKVKENVANKTQKVKENVANKAQKVEEKSTPKKTQNEVIIAETNGKQSTLSKNQKKRLAKQKEKEQAKPETPKVKEEAPKSAPKPVQKPSTPKVKSVSPVKIITPKKSAKSEDPINEDSKKLGKNAKRKLQRKDAEDIIKQKEAELKKLRQAIYEGINGYSQEEASKSMSESDCDSPAKASEVDEFLSKISKVGKSAAKGSTGNKSDSSSDFGSVDKL